MHAYQELQAVGFMFACVAFFIYILPLCVAGWREHPNFAAISILNLFLGFTFIGWVVALVWASTAIKRDPQTEE